MIGDGYWATGIMLTPAGFDWRLTLDFYDSGFAEDHSTEGTLRVRYDVQRAKVLENARVLIADAKRLGITWRNGPQVYVAGDGEHDDGDRPEERRFANEIADGLGWSRAYTREGAQ